MVLPDVAQDFRRHISLTTSNSEYFYKWILNLQYWLFSIITSFTQRCRRSTNSNSIKILDFIRSIIRKCFLYRMYEVSPYSYPSPRNNHNLFHKFPGYQAIFHLGTPHLIMLDRYMYEIFIQPFPAPQVKNAYPCLPVLILVLFIYLDIVTDSSAVTCTRSLNIFFSNHGVPNEI